MLLMVALQWRTGNSWRQGTTNTLVNMRNRSSKKKQWNYAHTIKTSSNSTSKSVRRLAIQLPWSLLRIVPQVPRPPKPMTLAAWSTISSSVLAKRLCSRRTCGVMQVCFVQGSFISLLCKRFMLIVCICLPGLINGSTGRIFKIIYRPNRHPPMLPDLLLAEFPQYLGPSYLDSHDHIVPLTPFTHTWITKEKKNYARTQFPVLPGDSFSVHGAQGKTEAKTICNLGGMFAHFNLNDHISVNCSLF